MLKPWVAVLTSFYQTPIFAKVWLSVAGLGVYAAIVALLNQLLLTDVKTLGSQLHGLLGLALGLLLVFRTNTSYDRWWEARKLWGQLVNDSRNLAIKVAACVRADPKDKHQLARRLADFAESLKTHLLADSPHGDAPVAPASTTHEPMAIARSIYEHVERWRRSGQLDGFEFWILDLHTSSLMNICGACERIQKTPIAISHRWFIQQSIALYVLTLPWGLVEQFHYWTVPATMLVSYLLIGIELIAEAVENPFGHSADDLRLADICHTIEQSVFEVLPAADSSGEFEPIVT